MRYFIDTAPSAPSQKPRFALLAEDGRECVAGEGQTTEEITTALTAFCDAEQYGPPDVWAYDPEATTTELQEALGGALPEGWPEDCHSLQVQAVALGSPTLPAMPTDPDDVRLGARWARDVWMFLTNYAGAPLEPPLTAEPPVRSGRGKPVTVREDTRKEQ